MNWNWSMVGTDVLGAIADGVRDTGIAPRGAQLDCWWYPVQQSSHPFWCVSDWVLPEPFYPNGTGGVRKSMGVPLILYFPALCTKNAWNAGGKYTWTDTNRSGFVLPIAEQSAEFWGDMFDYGAALAAKSVDPAAGTMTSTSFRPVFARFLAPPHPHMHMRCAVLYFVPVLIGC